MSVTANLTTNVETITATIVVEDETIIAEINTAARGPAGPAGGGSSSITSATTSDGTADLSLSNVTTATATVSGTLTADHIHGNLAGNVYGHVRAGETLAKGDPVYVSGSHGSGSTLIPIVSKADASNAAKMPAIGIMDAAVANNANGHMVIIGTITELNTVGYSINAELYVAAGGGLAVTPPTGRAQPVARVERANGTNGAIIVKVNGLSASAATANTLVLRDASGGAQFSDLVASTSFDAGMFAVDPLVGSTFEAGSSIAFNSTAYTYGTGAASAHRIALGAGTTGATLFGAATAAAANESLGITLLSAPSASATRNNNTLADDSVLAGMTLEANTNYLIDFNFAFFASASSGFRWRFNATSCSSHIQYHCGTAATPGATLLPLYLTGSTGLLDTITRTSSATSGYTYSGFLIFRTGASAGSLSLQWAQNTTDAAQTASRSAHSWLRLTKIS
jgi:hypothetical protein